ncbi:MAG: hypothetical protein BroJett040_18270 [Oligoflexia bacterium]|nr:MAG: hypothetical protein BroJett040_18270 [Oligoflexia bacterium]
MVKQCAACGNRYDKPIEITYNGRTEYFDCFECAIHVLAPKCVDCGVSIIGHGVEADGVMFCSAHCARMHGEMDLSDRLPARGTYLHPEF